MQTGNDNTIGIQNFHYQFKDTHKGGWLVLLLVIVVVYLANLEDDQE